MCLFFFFFFFLTEEQRYSLTQLQDSYCTHIFSLSPLSRSLSFNLDKQHEYFHNIPVHSKFWTPYYRTQLEYVFVSFICTTTLIRIRYPHLNARNMRFQRKSTSVSPASINLTTANLIIHLVVDVYSKDFTSSECHVGQIFNNPLLAVMGSSIRQTSVRMLLID